MIILILEMRERERERVEEFTVQFKLKNNL